MTQKNTSNQLVEDLLPECEFVYLYPNTYKGKGFG